MHGAQRMHGALKLDMQAPAQTKGAQAILKELELNLGAVVAAVPADVCGREVTLSHITVGLSKFSNTSTGIGGRRSTCGCEGEVTSRGRVLCRRI